MGIQHANSELVARAWLSSLPGLPAGKVGTTLPQDKTTWNTTGFVQVGVAGRGGLNPELRLRAPVITATCWAVNSNSAQQPPWGKACDLAEVILAACYEANGQEGVTLSVPGAPKVRVLQAWPVSEPRRLPVKDDTARARYVVDFQIAWCELP